MIIREKVKERIELWAAIHALTGLSIYVAACMIGVLGTIAGRPDHVETAGVIMLVSVPFTMFPLACHGMIERLEKTP